MKIFRKILFWIHLVVGLAAGGVIAVVAFTGATMAFEKQVVAWAERDLRHVTRPTPDAPRLPLTTILERVRAAQPEARPAGVIVSSDATDPLTLSLGRTGSLYVNPYTGETQPSGAKDVRAFFRLMLTWHRWLGVSGPVRETSSVGGVPSPRVNSARETTPPTLSDSPSENLLDSEFNAAREEGPPTRGASSALTAHQFARSVVGVACIVFLTLCVSGLYLWWPKKWNWRAFKTTSLVNLKLRGKARDWNLAQRRRPLVRARPDRHHVHRPDHGLPRIRRLDLPTPCHSRRRQPFRGIGRHRPHTACRRCSTRPRRAARDRAKRNSRVGNDHAPFPQSPGPRWPRRRSRWSRRSRPRQRSRSPARPRRSSCRSRKSIIETRKSSGPRSTGRHDFRPQTRLGARSHHAANRSLHRRPAAPLECLRSAVRADDALAQPHAPHRRGRRNPRPDARVPRLHRRPRPRLHRLRPELPAFLQTPTTTRPRSRGRHRFNPASATGASAAQRLRPQHHLKFSSH